MARLPPSTTTTVPFDLRMCFVLVVFGLDPARPQPLESDAPSSPHFISTAIVAADTRHYVSSPDFNTPSVSPPALLIRTLAQSLLPLPLLCDTLLRLSLAVPDRSSLPLRSTFLICPDLVQSAEELG
ncbi:hypothetical protein EIP91_009216 [Steccherinum ochraceum]|uniref:Uncharacterized protein n=1 Tax=Steccherinum ochraceum TaxID=92696 RepID=A0A4R0S004_9APHY|nr:hypothetical protein EIP91_009216 [Steccherinum ochraceum]